jgi:ribosomal-protein-alanine N-acetyltransferase
MRPDFRFTTTRLVADEWHVFERETRPHIELALVVQSILTPPVTASLPATWQGTYTCQRASEWIVERDQEGINLLVIERSSSTPVGLLIFFEDDPRTIRIGYMFAETAWRKGYATELILGFADWCRHAGIQNIIAGIAPHNVASQRVLEKCGFSQMTHENKSAELLFELPIEAIRSG